MIQAWRARHLLKLVALPAAVWLLLTAVGAAETVTAGSTLIGNLEGPEVMTDPAQVPGSLHEAPALTELVKAGKLPPVKERIGDDPLVIKPLREIGRYGGIWRRGFTGPADTSYTLSLHDALPIYRKSVV